MSNHIFPVTHRLIVFLYLAWSFDLHLSLQLGIRCLTTALPFSICCSGLTCRGMDQGGQSSSRCPSATATNTRCHRIVSKPPGTCVTYHMYEDRRMWQSESRKNTIPAQVPVSDRNHDASDGEASPSSALLIRRITSPFICEVLLDIDFFPFQDLEGIGVGFGGRKSRT